MYNMGLRRSGPVRRYKKVIRWVLIILIVIFSLVFLYAYNSGFSIEGSLPEIGDSIKGDEVLSVEDMKEDLDFIVERLKKIHPKTYNGFTKEQEELIENIYIKIKVPMEAQDFYFLANEIVTSFKDAHTSLSLSKNENNRGLKLKIKWLYDGLYITSSSGTLNKGDEIISIGDETIEDILKELEKIIPAENIYWVKVIGEKYILDEFFLKHLNLIHNNEDVKVKVKRGEETIVSKIKLEENYREKEDKKLAYYNIYKENSLGIFTLNSCENNGEYNNKLESFFKEVRDNKIENIAVDLRNNTGGNSKVINSFISYLNIDDYKVFSGTYIRFSKYASDQNGHLKNFGYKEFSGSNDKNKKVKDNTLLFNGKTYVLTSNKTFSSANDFAMTIKDNNIGTIIGEPTGNAPSCYGDIIMCQSPKGKFILSVSYKRFYRADKSKNNETYMSPDIIVNTTIEDIINDKDPQVEKLKEVTNISLN